MNQLRRLEGKVDQISFQSEQSFFNSANPGPSLIRLPDYNIHIENPSVNVSSSVRPSKQSAYTSTTRGQPQRPTPAAHKILTWPAVQQALFQFLPAGVEDINAHGQDGTTFLVGFSKAQSPLPSDDKLRQVPLLETVDVSSTTHTEVGGICRFKQDAIG